MASLHTTTQARLDSVRDRIAGAARAAGRQPGEITLLAVSKTFDAGRVVEAIAAGQRHFGENYLQEALAKQADLAQRMQADRVLAEQLSASPINWHFIGPVQSNKTRELAANFDWVQSVDRVRIAERLSTQRPASLPELSVLLQVNISHEPSKQGVAPEQVVELAREVAALPRLRLRGLMAIPQPQSDPQQQRRIFGKMHSLLEETRRQLAGVQLPPGRQPDLDTLSMGMSDDLETAIAEGSTMVRVGTAIFGARQ
jgi:PLP dependent protein